MDFAIGQKGEMMNDLISRQAAIARAVPLNLFGREVMIVSVSELENLPSAQPEIIRCGDCKWKNGHNCTRAVEVWIDDDKFCAWAERRQDE